MKTQKNKLSSIYKTADVTATNGTAERTEKIDLVKNKLFSSVKSANEIKKIYESFWGRAIQVKCIELKN